MRDLLTVLAENTMTSYLYSCKTEWCYRGHDCFMFGTFSDNKVDIVRGVFIPCPLFKVYTVN